MWWLTTFRMTTEQRCAFPDDGLTLPALGWPSPRSPPSRSPGAGPRWASGCQLGRKPGRRAGRLSLGSESTGTSKELEALRTAPLGCTPPPRALCLPRASQGPGGCSQLLRGITAPSVNMPFVSVVGMSWNPRLSPRWGGTLTTDLSGRSCLHLAPAHGCLRRDGGFPQHRDGQ